MKYLASISVLVLVVFALSSSSIACWTCSDPGGCVLSSDGTHLKCLYPPCQLALGCNGSGCFLAGTMVETPEGPKDIEKLRTGDTVLSADSWGNVREATITSTYRNFAREFLVINGRLRVTATHPFRVGSKWVDAGQLRVGDTLVNRAGKGEVVLSKRLIQKGVRVYNVEVAGDHTFFANGLLVHNKSGDPTVP